MTMAADKTQRLHNSGKYRAWRHHRSSSSDSLRPDIECCLTRQHVSVPSAYHFDVLLGERHPLLAAE
jgi:hypothetical protein